MSWINSKKSHYVAASAEGCTKLNAFDNALLKMGTGNVNLVKLSSVNPCYARLEEKLCSL